MRRRERYGSLKEPSFVGVVEDFSNRVISKEEGSTMASAEQLVLELIVPEQRENALLDLSKVSSFLRNELGH